MIQPIISTTNTMMMTAVHMPALKMSPITWQLVIKTARKANKLKKYNLKFFIVFEFSLRINKELLFSRPFVYEN